MRASKAPGEDLLSGIICGDTHMSKAAFDAAVRRAAAGFEAMGIGEGDCVAIFLRNDIPFLVASRAAAWVGAYAVPVNWHLAGEELSFILDDCDAKVLIVHADLWHKVRGDIPDRIDCVIVETSPDLARAYKLDADLCTAPAGMTEWSNWLAGFEPTTNPARIGPSSMIYTSGTTGRPKGVRRATPTPEQVRQSMDFRARVYGCRPGGRLVVPGPLYHSAPNSYALQAASIGELLVIMPRFETEDFLRLIEAHRLTGAIMVPIMFVRLLRQRKGFRRDYDLSSLEFIIHAAAPCPADVKREMIAWFGPVINEFYGSTESGAVTACNSEQALARPGTVGKIIPEADVMILDDKGAVLPAGEIGEIYSRFGLFESFEYNKRPDERAEIDIDGYITSGDMGYLDEDGFLFIADRVRDMVISGGVNIYPAEIEAVLHSHPMVRDCAVFGIPDAEFGEALLAVIEPDGDTNPDPGAIQAFLREHLAGFKVPRNYEFAHDLPREDSGKIFKRRIRDAFWKEAGRQV